MCVTRHSGPRSAGVGVVDLPSARGIVAGVVDHDGAIVRSVAQVGIQNRAVALDDVGHVFHRADAEGVVARAHFSLTVVGRPIGEPPGDGKQDREEGETADDRTTLSPGEFASPVAAPSIPLCHAVAFRYPRGYTWVQPRRVT